MFCLYNRTYRIRCFLAPDIETAKKMAMHVGHVRRPYFRRVIELTLDDETLGAADRKALERALAGEMPGVAEYIDGEWKIEPIKGSMK